MKLMLHISTVKLAFVACIFIFAQSFLIRPEAVRHARSALISLKDAQGRMADVSADVIRNLELINSLGRKQKVGTLSGNGKSVVVFLRHLG